MVPGSLGGAGVAAGRYVLVGGATLSSPVLGCVQQVSLVGWRDDQVGGQEVLVDTDEDLVLGLDAAHDSDDVLVVRLAQQEAVRLYSLHDKQHYH